MESAECVGSHFFFRLALPVLDEVGRAAFMALRQSQQKAASMLAAGGSRLQGVSVLLVEDNPVNQQVANELLIAEGASVSIAQNGEEALVLLEDQCRCQVLPDVVLMDLQMPVMDGLTATRYLRQVPAMKTLPVIAMTANVMAADRENCLAAGMNDHVGKPFDVEYLMAVILRNIKKGEASNAESVAAESGAVCADVTVMAAGKAEYFTELDVQKAISRLGGKQALYLRMLSGFSDHIQSMPVQLRAQVSKGDWPSAVRELHTLKGIAGTVGAQELADLAYMLEQQLRGAPDALTASWLDELDCALLHAFNATQQLMQTLR